MAAGKSTVSSRVAHELGYPFLDTGAMYRAITWLALESGVDPEDEVALAELAAEALIEAGPPLTPEEPCSMRVNGRDVTSDLRSPAVEAAVSLVSRVAAVRRRLVATQQRIAAQGPIVMAGRDIGTVVLPEAELKLYLDASLAERARRRHQELRERGDPRSLRVLRADLRRRDAIDSTRAVSPLQPAPDAHVLQTDGLTLEEVIQRVLALVRCRCFSGSPTRS